MPAIKKELGLLGSCEAAERLCINRSTLRYWRLKGRLIPAKVISTPNGLRYLYSPEQIEPFRVRINEDS
jgi:DNA-binding transcriptional MerR regulator